MRARPAPWSEPANLERNGECATEKEKFFEMYERDAEASFFSVYTSVNSCRLIRFS